MEAFLHKAPLFFTGSSLYDRIPGGGKPEVPLFAKDETKAKLLILFFLEQADIPLTRDQLYRAMYENECMDYFMFQQIFYDLEEEGLVAVRPMAFGHAFSMTGRGKETLSLFRESLPTQLVSTMEEQADGSYEVRLMAQERSRVILEIRMSLATRSMAQKVRADWGENAEEIYSYLLGKLLENR